jgi:hypothetical protein
MYTRRVVFRLRADSSAEFTRIAGGDVLPVLRAQEGCRHEDTFITPQFSEAVLNSYWDTEARAEAYDRAGYLAALKSLAAVPDGEPRATAMPVKRADARGASALSDVCSREIGRGVTHES